MLSRGTPSARKLPRARVLLKAAAGWRDQDIAHAVDTSRLTVERIRHCQDNFLRASLLQGGRCTQ